MLPIRTAIALACVALIYSTTFADNWSNWRGPAGNGTAEGENYATTWGDDENILWKVELPGVGGSTPAIWGDRIFVTSPSESKKAGENLVICFNRDGKQLWQRDLGKERQGKHKKGSGSNPSPVTDGQHVYAYFKSGNFACLDFDGKVVWQKNLQEEFAEDTLWWDLGTSPVLTDSAIVVACVQSGPSYLAAFDLKTGDLIWKQDRMMGAPEESTQTYSTPIVVGSGDDQRIIVLGADHVTGHLAKTGEELWRVGGLNPKNDPYFRSISSPVLSGDMVIAPYARGGSLTGIKLGGRGDVTKSHVAWSQEGPAADVPTPTTFGDHVIVLEDKGQVAIVNPATGETVSSTSLPKNRNAFSASPVIADGKIYAVREDGTTYVLNADDLELEAENTLDDRVVATPVFVDGRIYLRGAEHLYCIGK